MKKLFLFLFVMILFVLAGCSKQPEEMSTVRINLILDIFKLIKQNRHEEAYIKVKKLRELDPTNVHLPVLEEVEKENSELQKLNILLSDKRKQAKAIEYLKKIVEEQGESNKNKSSRTAARLKDLFRLDELSDIIVSPKAEFKDNLKYLPASKVLDNAIEEFVLITQKWNISYRIRNKAIRQKQKVARLRREESLRAVQSLELFAPGLSERDFQTMMAMSLYAAESGTK